MSERVDDGRTRPVELYPDRGEVGVGGSVRAPPTTGVDLWVCTKSFEVEVIV
jgi:hypothetical protein